MTEKILTDAQLISALKQGPIQFDSEDGIHTVASPAVGQYTLDGQPVFFEIIAECFGHYNADYAADVYYPFTPST